MDCSSPVTSLCNPYRNKVLILGSSGGTSESELLLFSPPFSFLERLLLINLEYPVEDESGTANDDDADVGSGEDKKGQGSVEAAVVGGGLALMGTKPIA